MEMGQMCRPIKIPAYIFAMWQYMITFAYSTNISNAGPSGILRA